VMLVKEGMTLQVEWTAFFAQSVMLLSFVGLLITFYAIYYFNKKKKTNFIPLI